MNPILKALLGSWDWRPDVIAVVALLGTGYGTGWWRLKRRSAGRATTWPLALYLTALATVCLALLSPIDSLGESLFSFHMLQHELLILITAPLLLLANPLSPLLWGLPRGLRLRLGRLLTRGAAARRVLRGMTRMVVALPLYLVTLWGWHYPPAFEAALGSDLIHDLMHLSFFLTGLLFWWPIINPAPRLHGHIPYGFRIFYVAAAAIPTMPLSMGLALFANRVLYPYYTTVPPLGEQTVLQDQTIGWVVMGLAEGGVYLITMLLLVGLLLQEEERMVRLEQALVYSGDAPPRR